MNERIKELAVQAIQETAKQGVHDGLAMSLNALERFAELVRQDERDACAKLCEEENWSYAMGNIIRARKETT